MILVNGEKQQSLPVTDRGLHYGDGLFETIAVKQGRMQLWQLHMQRLFKGCQRLGIPSPDEVLLRQEAEQVCAGSECAVLKIIITRGSGGRGYRPPESCEPTRILIRYPWPEHADNNEAIRIRLCQATLGSNPALAGIKHLNRLEQVIARNEWKDGAIAEGVMCDTRGTVIEGTMSNLFGVRAGRLITPDLSQCGIEGVMRGQIITMSQHLRIPCEIMSFGRDALEAMDEVFICNSVLGIRPVAQFEQVAYGDNPITRQLQNALQEVLEEQ